MPAFIPEVPEASSGYTGLLSHTSTPDDEAAGEIEVVAFDHQEPALELGQLRDLDDAPDQLLARPSAGWALPAKMNSTGRSGSPTVCRSSSRFSSSSAARL